MVKYIEDLKIGEWIVYQTNKGNKYGQIVYFSFPFSDNSIQIIVESVDGMQYQIGEHVVLEKVSKDIAKELSLYKNTMEEKEMAKSSELREKEVPTHYQGSSDIDLIEFFYQQWGLEALKAVTSFNIQRYALRLGRKDEETNELWKIIDYAERYIEKKEKEND